MPPPPMIWLLAKLNPRQLRERKHGITGEVGKERLRGLTRRWIVQRVVRILTVRRMPTRASFTSDGDSVERKLSESV